MENGSAFISILFIFHLTEKEIFDIDHIESLFTSLLQKVGGLTTHITTVFFLPGFDQL